METKWSLTIVYYKDESLLSPLSIGLQLPTPLEVEELGELLDSPVAGAGASNTGRQLRVEFFEHDPNLHVLLEAIKNRYGLLPSEWFIIPVERRKQYFGVQKSRIYSSKELSQAPYLLLYYATSPIAVQTDGSAEAVELETYVAQADPTKYTRIEFGTLMPFHGICVAEPLVKKMQDMGLKGLQFEPVQFVPEDVPMRPLYKLGSEVRAPKSQLPLVSNQGHEIEPNTVYPCYFDDFGYQPVELRYSAGEFASFSNYDIVMSYERTGVSKARSFRWCLVSQKFRQALKALNVRGVQYAPVRVV